MVTIEEAYKFMWSFFMIFMVTFLRKMYLNIWLRKKFKNMKDNEFKNIIKKKENKKIKIGLLTNEIPPVVYGGVSTWIVNFIKMFQGDEDFEIVPIFLAYMDEPHPTFFKKYPNIRIVRNDEDIKKSFSDINICVNNLWIANDCVEKIKNYNKDLKMISVCHSLIIMEHLTNLGSIYTNNYFEQEETFKHSDYVVLISKAEKDYYFKHGYNKHPAKTIVIYNSYTPKYDDVRLEIDYSKNDLGYIGRHVPRKRPELPIMAVKKSERDDINVVNMGSKKGNEYWDKLKKEYGNLKVINFSTDPKKKKEYWESVGANSIVGIYEPFGYTICETLDRGVPAIVQNLDGPKEIIDIFKEFVFMYDVKQKFEEDIDSFLEAAKKFWDTPPEVRKEMAEKARKALDRFRPEVIKKDWKGLLEKI